MNYLYWGVFVLWMLFILFVGVYSSNCKCGKVRKWYFGRFHEVSWIMWSAVPFCFVLGFIGIFMSVAPFIWIWNVYYIRRAWFHDKDKIKKAAKAAGRVVVKDNGRLAVE